MTQLISVRGQTTYMPIDSTLELRLDLTPQQSEQSKSATTDDARVSVPWLLEPLVMISFYYESPWLGAIGNLLADAVAGATPTLEARDDQTKAKGKNDEEYKVAYQWLKREDMGGEGVSNLTISGLLRSFVMADDITGNIFVELIRNKAGTDLMRFQHLLPQYLRYEFKEKELKLHQEDPYKGQHDFVPFGSRPSGDTQNREYIHIRQSNLLSSFYGVPQWYWSKTPVEVDNAHRMFLKGFFKRHSTPRHVVHITQDPAWTGVAPTKDDLDKIYAHALSFISANAGEMAGRSMVIQYPGGVIVKFEAVDAKVEDPTFSKLSSVSRDEILAVRRISMGMLGGSDTTNRSTAQENTNNFIALVLEPFAKPAVSIINTVLHAEKPHGLGIKNWDFKLNFERIDDTLRRINAVVNAVGGPVLTKDEGRVDFLGYEEDKQGKVYQPVNMIESGTPLVSDITDNEL